MNTVNKQLEHMSIKDLPEISHSFIYIYEKMVVSKFNFLYQA